MSNLGGWALVFLVGGGVLLYNLYENSPSSSIQSVANSTKYPMLITKRIYEKNLRDGIYICEEPDSMNTCNSITWNVNKNSDGGTVFTPAGQTLAMIGTSRWEGNRNCVDIDNPFEEIYVMNGPIPELSIQLTGYEKLAKAEVRTVSSAIFAGLSGKACTESHYLEDGTIVSKTYINGVEKEDLQTSSKAYEYSGLTFNHRLRTLEE